MNFTKTKAINDPNLVDLVSIQSSNKIGFFEQEMALKIQQNNKKQNIIKGDNDKNN